MKKTVKRGIAVLSIAAMMGIQMTTGVLAEEVTANASGVPLVFEGNCSYQTQTRILAGRTGSQKNHSAVPLENPCVWKGSKSKLAISRIWV